MKALQFLKTGDLSALQLAELPMPVPAAGEVLVQIKAAGLNPSDVKNVLGRFSYTTLPRVPGRDFAGVVVEGPQALLGQEVWGTGKELGFTGDGSHAQYLTLSAKGVALKPTHLSFAQAASLGVPYTTAWDALERSLVKAETRLLVIGANGAVGSATIALAKIRGAQVLAAVRRPEQARALQARGFEAIVLQWRVSRRGRGDFRHHRFLAAGGGRGIGAVRPHRDHCRSGRWACAVAGIGLVPQGWFGGGYQFVALRHRGVCTDARAIRSLLR